MNFDCFFISLSFFLAARLPILGVYRNRIIGRENFLFLGHSQFLEVFATLYKIALNTLRL